MGHAVTTLSMFIAIAIGVVVALALLVVLLGAVAVVFARWRPEKEATRIDLLALALIMAAGMVVNLVTLTMACCWDRIRGKPAPPSR